MLGTRILWLSQHHHPDQDRTTTIKYCRDSFGTPDGNLGPLSVNSVPNHSSQAWFVAVSAGANTGFSN
eukprot:COSAG02_NODE_6864_length_3318_cov_1.732526_3_plen_68_part_00